MAIGGGSNQNDSWNQWLCQQLGGQEQSGVQRFDGRVFTQGGMVVSGTGTSPGSWTASFDPAVSPEDDERFPGVETVPVPTKEYETLVELASLVDALLEDFEPELPTQAKRVEYFALRERLNRWLLIRSTVTATQSEELLSLLRIREKLHP